MNVSTWGLTRGILLGGIFLLISACATPLTAPPGSETARSKLTQLQSDSQLATRAPVEIREAEAAVRAAEEPRQDGEYARHLVLIADHKVDIAHARARSRLYEDQRQGLSEQSERARLEARTREADRARMDAQSARSDAVVARGDAEAARLETEELQRQIAELNARETDRGLVVTLGDLLFATGRADLTGGAGPNLDKLAAFLQEYRDRTVVIEGHTDSVGSAESNLLLSQRRADSVRSYLVGRGVDPSRLSTSGLGMGVPIADNDTATGRQQNRRVEIIISSAATAARGN